MKIQTEIIKNVCIDVLRKRESPLVVAKKVVGDLLENEYQGYSSHGIIRILEYVQAIDQKNILPRNKPETLNVSENATIV
ncbi:MAG: hypothetical protein K2Q34_00255, partial [Alphaproteobacteria bacterium]|nr:hypothetical protein [Alphaproteobacteria bacterium]